MANKEFPYYNEIVIGAAPTSALNNTYNKRIQEDTKMGRYNSDDDFDWMADPDDNSEEQNNTSTDIIAVEQFLKNINEMDVVEAVPEAQRIMSTLAAKIKKLDEKAIEKKENIERYTSRSAGLFHKKAAIEDLQYAATDIAELQGDMIEAQKLSFINQAALAQISNALFRLGVMNRANNDMMVDKITKMLNEASQEELDELSRAQLAKTLTDLKNQESIRKKQESLTNEVRGCYEKLKLQDTINSNTDRSMQLINDKDRMQDTELSRQAAALNNNMYRTEELEKKLNYFGNELANLGNRMQHQNGAGAPRTSAGTTAWLVIVSIMATASLVLNAVLLAGTM